MDDSGGVHRHEASSQTDPDIEHAPPRHRCLLSIERATRHILGDEKRAAVHDSDPKHEHDVRVNNSRQSPAYYQKSPQATAPVVGMGDELDRHRPIEEKIVHQIDLAHTARAK